MLEISVKKGFCFTVFALKNCSGHFTGDAVEDQFFRERERETSFLEREMYAKPRRAEHVYFA